MTDHRCEIHALIDPEHTELLPHGSVHQHVSLIMSDPPQIDEHSPPCLAASVVTLRPEQARQLACKLLKLADQAAQMRSPA